MHLVPAIEITTLTSPVKATLTIPGSKSYTNRALVMAVLTKGPVTLWYPLYSEDTKAMIACLRTLGIRIDIFSDRLIVLDDISCIQEDSYELFAHESGTTARFLLALLCLVPGVKTLKGSTRLNERPIHDLVEALRTLGADLDYVETEGQLPISIRSSFLLSHQEVLLDASISSQFLSSLLMIAPYLNGLTIHLKDHPISISYAEMTIEMMREWGVQVIRTDNNFFIAPRQHYRKKEYLIEGDFSSAGYFFAIAALTQSTITLRNLSPQSVQADRHFLAILEDMGHHVEANTDGITLTGQKILPLSLNMEMCPDQVQTMAVLAAFAKGPTTIFGVRSLRVKETERVEALKIELAKMGIRTEDTHDSLTIYGGTPHCATIDTYGDHRMAMAFAVAGTKLPGMKIRQPHVVNKTYPSFWETLRSL
jgi:3-phosphoshikimate 1-carboxyvinyltransferase